MKFECDEQTIADLNIFQNGPDGKSVFSLFNRAVTFGGADKLREIFSQPLTDAEQIRQRISVIEYLQSVDIKLEIDKGVCDFIEFYLSQKDKPTSVSKIRAIEKKIAYYFNNSNEYYVIESGIKYTLQVLESLHSFVLNSDCNLMPQVLQRFCTTISKVLADDDFKFLQQININKPGAVDIAKADYLFRYKGFERLKTLMDIVYQLDVFISVGIQCKKLGYTFPVVQNTDNQQLLLTGVFHPFIDTAVPNNVDFSNQQNVCFITGTNMAGKSTLLKAIGISIYLSQIGFPVPALSMSTTIFSGLITTINLADNISHGSSHFYTEVLRVKHVAQMMAAHQNVFVIFDELFRGTNVKDAYDASLSIISAFARVKTSFFVISTHIVEVANDLVGVENINFKFMETVFNDGKPRFSYRLKDGITEERLGMWIVKNEGIIDIIENIRISKS